MEIKNVDEIQKLLFQRTSLLEYKLIRQKKLKIPALILSTYLGIYRGFGFVQLNINLYANKMITDEMIRD